MQKSVLLISPDEQFTRGVRWKLEDDGFQVMTSPSLEESFLSNSGSEVAAVIVDVEALDPESYWQARQQLDWFRRSCTVLLSGEEKCESLEESSDGFISKAVSKENLLERLRALS